MSGFSDARVVCCHVSPRIFLYSYAVYKYIDLVLFKNLKNKIKIISTSMDIPCQIEVAYLHLHLKF